MKLRASATKCYSYKETSRHSPDNRLFRMSKTEINVGRGLYNPCGQNHLRITGYGQLFPLISRLISTIFIEAADHLDLVDAGTQPKRSRILAVSHSIWVVFLARYNLRGPHLLQAYEKPRHANEPWSQWIAVHFWLSSDGYGFMRYANHLLWHALVARFDILGPVPEPPHYFTRLH